MSEELNKVILIGGDHHNGLALLRIFGINGIKPIIYIVCEKKYKPFINKSKYCGISYKVNTDDEALDSILKNYSLESKKPVIIPYSDGAAEALDRRLNDFNSAFIVPSIANKQCEICKWMNKKKQCDFAEKYNIPMAKTWEYDFNDKIPPDIIYPCIIKPVASYEGNKADIKKCESLIELDEAIKIISKLGYKRILIQQFMNIDYEFCIEGCSGRDGSFIASSTERSWPIVGGTGSFDRVIYDNDIKYMALKIINALDTEGYDGLFDIDLFMVNGEIYLNEINWRNGARDFMCLGTKVYFPFVWYLNKIGIKTEKLKHFSYDTNQFGMDEATDLRHVFYNGLSLVTWNRDRRRTQSFALWYKSDLKPTFARYCNLVKGILSGKRG